ncbi:MAG TPA: hypothetical protein ENI87_10565, partial [bacterium]|nr:hypothetical protein [bacterium]
MFDPIRSTMVLLLALAAPLSGQDDPKFTLTAKLAPATAAAGDPIELVLIARTEHGWHAYGTLETTNVPVSLDTEALQLTGLELAGDAVIPPGDPTPTPVGESYPLPDTFEVRVPLKVAAGATGEVKVAGELGYQICDASVCERPNSAPFVAKLTLGGGGGGGLGLKPGLMLDPEEKVAIRARFDPATVRAGEVATLILDVHVVDGWHAYGTLETTNVPVGFDHAKQDFGDLEFEGEPVIPPGDEEVTPIGSTFPLPHEFVVKQVVRVPEGTEPGEIEVLGVLDYQVCTDSFCDPVAEGEFEAKLVVEAGEARAGDRVAPPDEPAKLDSNDPFATWWGLILACIGGGLFALAMPCTYPMIPITFSFFTKQAEKSGGNVVMLAVVYGLGIIAMFVGVGVALSAVIIDVV